MFWKKKREAALEARRRAIQVLENDIKVFEEIAAIYQAEAAALEQVAQDEKAVLRILDKEGPDAAMELLNGVLKGYSPNLRAEWSDT